MRIGVGLSMGRLGRSIVIRLGGGWCRGFGKEPEWEREKEGYDDACGDWRVVVRDTGVYCAGMGTI